MSSISLTQTAAVANGICLAQAVAGAGNLTLNGSLVSGGVATLTPPRRVLVASSGANSARVFTVVGTSRDGVAQSEELTGIGAGGSAYTVRDYATATVIAADAACVGNITVGTNAVASSEWIMDNPFATVWALSVGVVVVDGSPTYSVEYTFDDPNKQGVSGIPDPLDYSLLPSSFSPPRTWEHLVLRGQIATGDGNFANLPVFAHRVTVTAGTGTVTMQSVQAGII